MLQGIYIFIYKIPNNMLLVALRNRMEMIESDSERQTRQAGNIVSEFRKTNAQKNMFHEGVKMYNSLCATIRQCDGIESFKRTLKEYILSTIL